TGSYTPEKRLTNADLTKIVDTSDEWITIRTGIKERRIAAKDETTSDMASKAALNALEQAKVKPEDVDLILVATATPDMLFPATAPAQRCCNIGVARTALSARISAVTADSPIFYSCRAADRAAQSHATTSI